MIQEKAVPHISINFPSYDSLENGPLVFTHRPPPRILFSPNKTMKRPLNVKLPPMDTFVEDDVHKKHNKGIPQRDPIIIQSPRIKEEVIITAGGLISCEDDYFSPGSYADNNPSSLYHAVEMDNFPAELPKPTNTPSRLFVQMKIQDLIETISRTKIDYEEKIRKIEDLTQDRIDKLISLHTSECKAFDEKHGIFPRAESAITQPVLIHRAEKNKCRIRVPFEKPQSQRKFIRKNTFTGASESILTQRKEMIDRQQIEVLALNDEYLQETSVIYERTKRAMDKPVAQLNALLEELRGMGGNVKIPDLLLSSQPFTRDSVSSLKKSTVLKKSGVY